MEITHISNSGDKYGTILIVPCYNEEDRINEDAYYDFLVANPDYLLLFVDDGSTDKTKHVINKMLSKIGNLALLSSPGNKGKAAAVRFGVMHALDTYTAEYIGFIDADLSTPLGEFHAFEKEFEKNDSIAMVLGSRVQMLGKDISRNLLRHWISRFIATIICKVLDEPVYDTQCGAKLFSWRIAPGLFKEPFLSKWLFDVEILARHKKTPGLPSFKASVIEVPVSQWKEKKQSKLHYSQIFRILIDLQKINNHYF
jgi:dolichyl-phosphate beta-glucosyltransferase